MRQASDNVTGLSSAASELWPKRMQLFIEAFPTVKHLGMVFSPSIAISSGFPALRVTGGASVHGGF